MTHTKFHSPEDIQDSVESLYQTHGSNRPIVYWILMAVTAVAAICIPVVKVDMSVGAPGQVRPAIERLSVYPAVEGFIKELHVLDNQAVKKGDRLLVIDSTALDARVTQNGRQREENEGALGDLSLLLNSMGLLASGQSDDAVARFRAVNDEDFARELPKKLRTAQYVRQHALFLSDLQRLLLQRSKAMQDMARNKALHDRGLISDYDFEQQSYAAQSTEREFDLSILQTLGRWQAEKIEHELKKIDLDSETKQLEQQRGLYTLRAPVDGTALGFSGLHTGLFIPSGQRIGEISPVGGLQADVYISPRDVGFIQAGQRVNIQVDAFPYTEWGTLKGHVRDISQDFVQLGQQLAFKAVIDLDSMQLRSASGVAVDLRRGMTINARFLLKKRTLFNLLYSKISESLDPSAKPVAE